MRDQPPRLPARLRELHHHLIRPRGGAAHACAQHVALAHPGAVAIDGTLGMGGHTEALLRACPEARVVGIDRDADAIALASRRLAPFGERFAAHHAEYDDIAGALRLAGADVADGILLDLGVSSLQIDEADRALVYWALSSLMVAEERITTKFSGLVGAHGSEEEATFLATQQVDEARHMQFYARFRDEVIGEPQLIAAHVERAREQVSDAFRHIFDEELVAAHEKLVTEGVRTRVVSMPSWELFDRQPREYRDKVLPPQVRARIAIEQASTLGWERYVGESGRIIGMHTFGKSAPLKELQKHFGFEPERVVAAAHELLAK